MSTGDNLNKAEDLNRLINQLNEKTLSLQERESDLADKAEELSAQKEELTAAIEAFVEKNKSLQDALDQLRDRNFELDQILYRTSHDLRSPLSSIKGILTLLKLETQSETIKNYGQHIEHKTIQMENLLRSLASLSKSILEPPTFSIVDLNKIIRVTIEGSRYLPSWENVVVSVKLEADQIKTDFYLMTIIFQSLLSNAYIFRDPLKMGAISIHSIQKMGRLEVEVIDDGEGIPTQVQAHIFEMFYRGSERSLGNGLGLYVAKKAAEQLKGSLEFIMAHHTTCFRFSIPIIT